MMIEQWWIAFGYTQAIELIFGSLLYFVYRSPDSRSFQKIWVAIFIATSLTHPLLWFCITPLCKQIELSQVYYWVISESYVVLIESYWYKSCNFRFYFCFSLILNLLSYLSFFILF